MNQLLLVEGRTEDLENLFLQELEEAMKNNPQVVLGLPGGSSVKPLWRALELCSLDLTKVHVFWVDERFVPLDDPESNFKQAWEGVFQELVEKGRMPRANLHHFPYNPIDEGEDLQTYYNQFEALGGIFHLLVLGAGEDGHVASLFPGHNYWQKHQPALFFERDSPKPPSTRVTFGPPVLQDAQATILLFLGEGKRNALLHFLSEEVDVLDCPAKIVAQNPQLTVVTDMVL